MDIDGTVERGFEPVADAFAANFGANGDIGAAVCIYRHGGAVVDLWGGLADTDQGRPWDSDTLALVFSTTKGPTAICAHLLAERGQLDIDAPIASYWPDFAANGKEGILVRWVLCHRAGVPAVDAGLTLAGRGSRLGPGGRRCGPPGTGMAARHCARVSRPHLRLDHRRARPPHHRRDSRPVLRG
jgi:CubicO group peptidase (beta-lactamase class C family)